jgi:hypothetical protein
MWLYYILLLLTFVIENENGEESAKEVRVRDPLIQSIISFIFE